MDNLFNDLFNTNNKELEKFELLKRRMKQQRKYAESFKNNRGITIEEQKQEFIRYLAKCFINNYKTLGLND